MSYVGSEAIHSRNPQPIRVLHLTSGSHAGGVSRYLFDLCSAMHASGDDVSVAGGRGAWHTLFEEATFPWHETPMGGGAIQLWRTARKLVAHFGQRPPEVLHAHYRRSVLVGRLMQKMWRRRGITTPPLLFTLHLTGIPLGGLLGRLTDFGDHIHVASAEAAAWLQEAAGVPAERITMIPHGVDRARFPKASATNRHEARQKLGLPANAVVGAYVGRFDDPKNVMWVLDVAGAAKRHVPRSRFLLVGEGPHQAQLEKRIEREGLADQVHILGYRDPLAVYQACDLLMLPSSLEGFALVCAEAMSVGRAVLRTSTAGSQETVVDRVTGRVVPIEQDAFIEAAVAMLQHPVGLEQMGTAAVSHVDQHLRFERQLNATGQLYRWLIQAGDKNIVGLRSA